MAKVKSKKQPAQTIIIMLLQGRPRVISDDDGEPHAFENMDKAREFCNEPHMGIDGSEAVYILDCATGEIDHY